jgi:hypothetical protein
VFSTVVQEPQATVAEASQPQLTTSDMASAAPPVQTMADPTRVTAPDDIVSNATSQSAAVPSETSNQAPNQVAESSADVASIVLAAFASVSASVQESPADPTWIAKAAKAAVAEASMSTLGNSTGVAEPTGSPAASRKDFSQETAPNTSEVSAPSLTPLLPKLSAGDPVVGIKSETAVTTPTAPFQQFSISKDTGTASVKVPSVTTPVSILDSSSPSVASVGPTTSDEIVLPASAIPMTTAPVTDERMPTEGSGEVSTGSVTASSEPDDSETDGNSQAQSPAKNSDSASSTLPTSMAADPSALTLAVSIAATAPKSDASGPTTINTPSSTNAASDAPLSGSVAPHRTTALPELSETMQAWNGGDNVQTRLVQSARLGGNLRESEMNIAMQTETLGAVELRARVSGDVVGAAIGIERHDAHAMISGDLSSLHEALHDRQLRVGNVTVYQGSLHSGVATGDGGKPSHQQETAPQRPGNSVWTAGQSPVSIGAAGFGEGSDGNMIFDSNGRLSVRA